MNKTQEAGTDGTRRPPGPQGGVTMGRVMIKCPNTGKLVFTGVLSAKNMFDKSAIKETRMAKCPACGKEHIWTKEQAVLQE